MSLSLVTDRTQSDFDSWLNLSQIPWLQMTNEQKEVWSVPMKGAYNYTDLNRVGSAMLTLQALFVSLGYSVSVNVRTNYTIGEWPSQTDMNSYIQGLKNLRSAVPVSDATPAAPDSMDDGTVFIWNNIEQILLDVETIINYISTYSNQRVSSTFHAGSTQTLQHFSRGR